MTSPAQRTLWIIDDDLMCREILTLFASEAGFDAHCFPSGESALEALAPAAPPIPHAVLADMQMPGLAGDSLARLLRSTCGSATALVAMSGTPVPDSLLSAFDGFLLKPFTMDDLVATLQGHTATPPPPPPVTSAEALNPAIYKALSAAMTPGQVGQLYAMSLDDADRRIGLMQQAIAAGDADAFRRGAHSIKGGCGMVGATELAALAAEMEERGPEAIDNIGALTQFLDASARLRRILDAL